MSKRRKPVPSRLSGGDRHAVRVVGEQPLPLEVARPVPPPVPPPAVAPARPDYVLQDLQAASRRLLSAQRQVDELVREAHRAGHSFAAIGQVLGVSRQAARQRLQP